MTARVAVLVSGTGRSLENLARVVRAGELDVELALVLSDRPGVLALERAATLGIEALVVDWKEAGDVDTFASAVFREIESRSIDLIVLAGFLRLLKLPDAWLGRVLNIHPSLLPAYGGKGFYGNRVHRAVLAAGEEETGATVHLVDNVYDQGPIVLQQRVPVRPEDTVETLAARVFEAECEALPEGIRRVLRGEVEGVPAGGGRSTK